MNVGLLCKIRGELKHLEHVENIGSRTWKLSLRTLMRQPLSVLRGFVVLAERDIVMLRGDDAEDAIESYWDEPCEYPYEEEGWGAWCILVRLLYWRERWSLHRREAHG
jgi:hypothetical protein